METAPTSTTSSYAKGEPETPSITTGRRRLASIWEIAAGGSCLTPVQQNGQHQSQPSFKAARSPSCFLDDDEEEAWTASTSSASPLSRPHFLDVCRMCGKYLPWDQDTYMYKGDTPFCSEECREEHIRMDDAREQSRRQVRAISSEKEAVDKPGATSSTAVVAVGAL